MENSEKNELQVVKEFCLEGIQIEWENSPKEYKEDIQMRKTFERLKEVVIDAYNKGQLGVLKSYSKDITESIREYPFWKLKAADKRLTEKTGLGLKFFKVARHKEIKRILKIGKVKTADEYRLLESRVEEVFEENPDTIKYNEEVKKINSILEKITKPFIE